MNKHEWTLINIRQIEQALENEFSELKYYIIDEMINNEEFLILYAVSDEKLLRMDFMGIPTMFNDDQIFNIIQMHNYLFDNEFDGSYSYNDLIDYIKKQYEVAFSCGMNIRTTKRTLSVMKEYSSKSNKIKVL